MLWYPLEVPLMSTQNICFCGEIRKIFPPGTPSYLELWSLLYGNSTSGREGGCCSEVTIGGDCLWHSNFFSEKTGFIFHVKHLPFGWVREIRYVLFKPIVDLLDSPHYILEESNFNFRYVQIWDLDIPRQKWLNCLQTVEILFWCHVLQHLIWVCTVCQFLF